MAALAYYACEVRGQSTTVISDLAAMLTRGDIVELLTVFGRAASSSALVVVNDFSGSSFSGYVVSAGEPEWESELANQSPPLEFGMVKSFDELAVFDEGIPIISLAILGDVRYEFGTKVVWFLGKKRNAAITKLNELRDIIFPKLVTNFPSVWYMVACWRVVGVGGRGGCLGACCWCRVGLGVAGLAVALVLLEASVLIYASENYFCFR